MYSYSLIKTLVKIKQMEEGTKYIFRDSKGWRKKIEDEYNSYLRWSYKEIMKYIITNKDMPAQLAVEQFKKLMDEFSVNAKTSDQSVMFAIAYDTAIAVLDELYYVDEWGWKNESSID